MAIRYCLILIILLASSVSFAKNNRLRSIYKQKDYNQYVYSYQKAYRDYRKAPGTETIFYAQSLAKMKKFQRSNKIFSYILKKYYRKDLVNFRKKSEDEFNDNFVAILHKMGRNHLDSYINHPDSTTKKAKGFEKAYLYYYNALEDIDQVDDDAISMMEEDYEDFKKELKQRIYQFNYYVEAGYFAYQTAPVLVDSVGGATQLLANSLGISLGGGVRYENSQRAYFAAIKLVSGSATVKSQDSNINYLQNEAGVGLTIIEAGHLFKFANGKGELGGSLAILMSSGEFAEPTNFTIEDKDIMSIGYSIDSYYNFTDHWSLSLRIGNALSFESSTWNFGARYIF